MHLFSVKDDVLRLSHFVTDLVLKAIQLLSLLVYVVRILGLNHDFTQKSQISPRPLFSLQST